MASRKLLPGRGGIPGILFRAILNCSLKSKPDQVVYCSILAVRVFSSMWMAEDLMI